MGKLERWQQFGKDWAILSYYQRFEGIVAFVLTVVIAVIILVALYRLSASVIAGLVFGVLNPLEPSAFQAVFGEILTLLIALEFNHTLQYVVKREQSIIQTKVVLLIALLAIARKFIILDLGEVSPGQLVGLAAVALALGVCYWLMRRRAGASAPDGMHPRRGVPKNVPAPFCMPCIALHSTARAKVRGRRRQLMMQ